MKKAVVKGLKIAYAVVAIIWFFLACVLRIADSAAGIAVLEVVGIVGFGSWILQNYCEWRWN